MHRSRWAPWGAALIVLLLGLQWREISLREFEAQNQRTTAQAAKRLQQHLETRILTSSRGLRRMAERMSAQNPTHSEWKSDAANYVSDFPELRAIEWIDEDLKVRWIQPLKGNEAVLGRNLGFEPKRRSVIRTAKELGVLCISEPVRLIQGGTGLLIYAPIKKNGQFAGILAGVCDIAKLCDTIPGELSDDYAFWLQDHDSLFYTSQTPISAPGPEVQSATIKLLGQTWSIHARPKAEADQSWHSHLPDLISVASIVAAALIAFGFRQWGLAKTFAFQERKLRKEAQTSLSFLEQLLQSTPVGMVLVGLDGRFLRVNASLCRLLGYSEEELLGQTIMSLTHEEDHSQSKELVQKLLSGEQSHYEAEKRYRKKSGDLLYALICGTVLRDANDQPQYFLTQIQDISDRVERERGLLEAATLDGLTQLPNRRALDERLENEFSAVQRFGGTFSVIMLDVDRFKQINDEMGHAAGDEVLRGVAKILRQTCRSTDFPARFGGEEFAIVCPQTTVVDAFRLAERLRLGLEGSNLLPRLVTASFGVAEVSPASHDPASILREADLALYLAKEMGRNQVRYALHNKEAA